jgi:hypothetical protein
MRAVCGVHASLQPTAHLHRRHADHTRSARARASLVGVVVALQRACVCVCVQVREAGISGERSVGMYRLAHAQQQGWFSTSLSSPHRPAENHNSPLLRRVPTEGQQHLVLCEGRG